MKKILCFLLTLALCVPMLVSCGGGASIAIGALRLDNEVVNLFKFTDIIAVSETVTYTDGEGAPVFTAEYYYEEAEDLYEVYNVCETIGDYRLYAYEGEVYTETAEGVTAVLLLSGTYTDFVRSYTDATFPLDGDVLIQRNAVTEDGVITAQYETTLTPQQAARVAELGVSVDDTVVTTYRVRDSLIESVLYAVEKGDETIPLAKREILTSTEKDDRFASVRALSDETVGVDLVFVDSENKGRHFDVPHGVYVGMETGDYDYRFYRDAACTVPYRFDEAPVTEALTLYVKEA
ncbi:MAG: hypothetical protein IJV98_03535 [Clostridia bacterium]|nr:hypothetical protein [Clostridia bacterium]